MYIRPQQGGWVFRVEWQGQLVFVSPEAPGWRLGLLPTADPAKLRAGRLQSPKIIAEIRHNYGLDKSLPAQFWLYLKNLILHFQTVRAIPN